MKSFLFVIFCWVDLIGVSQISNVDSNKYQIGLSYTYFPDVFKESELITGSYFNSESNTISNFGVNFTKRLNLKCRIEFGILFTKQNNYTTGWGDQSYLVGSQGANYYFYFKKDLNNTFIDFPVKINIIKNSLRKLHFSFNFGLYPSYRIKKELNIQRLFIGIDPNNWHNTTITSNTNRVFLTTYLSSGIEYTFYKQFKFIFQVEASFISNALLHTDKMGSYEDVVEMYRQFRLNLGIRYSF